MAISPAVAPAPTHTAPAVSAIHAFAVKQTRGGCPAQGRACRGRQVSCTRGHARLPHGWKARCRDRALDEAAAEHPRLSFGCVVEHAGLARRHAVLTVEKIYLHAMRSPAEPSRLRRPRGAHLYEYLMPADAQRMLDAVLAQPVDLAQPHAAGAQGLARSHDHAAQ